MLKELIIARRRGYGTGGGGGDDGGNGGGDNGGNPQTTASDINHPYFAQTALPTFQTKTEIETYIASTTKLGYDSEDITYLSTNTSAGGVRNSSLYTSLFARMLDSGYSEPRSDEWIGLALQLVIDGNSSKGVQAIQNWYSSMQAKFQTDGIQAPYNNEEYYTAGANYKYVKDMWGYTWSGCFVLNWCYELFGSAGITTSSFYTLLKNCLNQGFSTAHKWPAQNFVNTDSGPSTGRQGGYAGHQGTFFYAHYIVGLTEKILNKRSASATGNATPTWDGLMQVHFAAGGFKDSINWRAQSQADFQGNYYGGEKQSMLLMIQFLFWKLSGKTKLLFNADVNNIPYSNYFAIDSTRSLFVNGDKNSSAGARDGDNLGQSTLFHCGAALRNCAGLAHIALLDYHKESFNRYQGQNSRNFQPIYRTPDYGNNPAAVPLAKFFGAPIENSIVACNKHDFSGSKNTGQVKTYDRIGSYYHSSHGMLTILSTYLFYNGPLMGQVGQMASMNSIESWSLHRQSAGGCTSLIYNDNESNYDARRLATGGVRFDGFNPKYSGWTNVYWYRDIQNQGFRLAELDTADIGYQGPNWNYTFISGKAAANAYGNRAEQNEMEVANFHFPTKLEGVYPMVKYVFRRVRASSSSYTKAEINNFYNTCVPYTSSGSARVVANSPDGYTGKVVIDYMLPKKFKLSVRNFGIETTNQGQRFLLFNKNLTNGVESTDDERLGGFYSLLESTNGAKQDYFLSRVVPCNASDSNPIASSVSVQETGDLLIMKDTEFKIIVVFVKSGQKQSSVNFSFSDGGLWKLLFTNLLPGNWIIGGVPREVPETKGTFYINGAPAGTYSGTYTPIS